MERSYVFDGHAIITQIDSMSYVIMESPPRSNFYGRCPYEVRANECYFQVEGGRIIQYECFINNRWILYASETRGQLKPRFTMEQDYARDVVTSVLDSADLNKIRANKGDEYADKIAVEFTRFNPTLLRVTSHNAKTYAQCLSACRENEGLLMDGHVPLTFHKAIITELSVKTSGDPIVLSPDCFMQYRLTQSQCFWLGRTSSRSKSLVRFLPDDVMCLISEFVSEF